MPLGLGVPELLIVLFIVLLIFGAGKLTQFGTDLGHGIRELRRGLRDDDEKKDDQGQNEAQAVEKGKA